VRDNYRNKMHVEVGIQYQQEHLADWERKLKPHVFAALKKWAESTNSSAVSGYDIRRGDQLYEFVANYRD
jgi:hypothetical protein